MLGTLHNMEVMNYAMTLEIVTLLLKQAPRASALMGVVSKFGGFHA